MKGSHHLFYLQPEENCLDPESSICYNSSVLSQHEIDKMLQITLMVQQVKEQMLADVGSHNHEDNSDEDPRIDLVRKNF